MAALIAGFGASASADEAPLRKVAVDAGVTMGTLRPLSGVQAAGAEDTAFYKAARVDLVRVHVSGAGEAEAIFPDMSADAALNARVMARFTDVFGAVRDRLVEAMHCREVHADVDPERLIELIGGATMMRLLLRPEDVLDASWIDQTAAILVHGVAL